MKLTRDKLKQIIKEELEEIVGQVTPQPQGPDGQENDQQKRILDMFNTVEEIKPNPSEALKFNVESPTSVSVSGRLFIRMQGKNDGFDVPFSTKIKSGDIVNQNLQQFYSSTLAPAALAAVENFYNKKYNLINKLPYNKLLAAWKNGSSSGMNAVANFTDLQNQVKAKQGQQPAAPPKQGQQPAAPPKQGLQEKFRKYITK